MNQRELKRILSFTGFGFASGLPYVLVFITLTAWLRSEGLDLSVIGFFGWITLTYSLKFLWAPTELQERKEVKAHSQMEIRPNPQKNSEFK